MIKNSSFLVVGRAGLDLYAEPPGTAMEDAEQFFATVGGSAANIAVGIVRQGGQATLLTCVSADAVGRTTIKKLKNFGVGTEYVRAVGGEARTSLAVVETRSENCQSVIYRNGAADFELGPVDIVDLPIDRFGAVIITGTCLAMEPSRATTLNIMSLAKGKRIPVIMDVDYRPYSWPSHEEAARIYRQAVAHCDFIIGNDEEFSVMAGQLGSHPAGLALARQLAETSERIVIYKMGELGSITFGASKEFETPIFTVRALKPTGAGDAFLASFITSIAAGQALATSVIRGSAAAAIVVGRVGCAPAMPTVIELNEFVSHHT